MSRKPEGYLFEVWTRSDRLDYRLSKPRWFTGSRFAQHSEHDLAILPSVDKQLRYLLSGGFDKLHYNL